MTGKVKLVLAIAAACLLLAIGWVLMGTAIWADLEPEEKRIVLEFMPQRLPLIVLLAFGGFALFSGIIVALYRAYVATPLRLVEEARLMLTVNRERRLPATGVAEVAAMASSLNELADQRDALLKDVDEKIAAAMAAVEEERNRLAALLSELTQGVIVCNLDGRVLLYNNRARLQFQSGVGDAQTGVRAGSLIGLGRSIFVVLERNLITHALDNIQHLLRKKSPRAVVTFVTSIGAGQLLRVQMSPVLGAVSGEGRVVGESAEVKLSGYVLILDNITDAFESGRRRDDMLRSLTEGSRAALGNIRVAVQMLRRYPDMEDSERDEFVEVIEKEVGKLSLRIQRSVTDQTDAMKARWPLEEMLGVDFVAAARRNIEAKIGVTTATEALDENVWLKIDSFSLLQAVTFLASRLHERFSIGELRLRLLHEGRSVNLDLLWSGPDIGADTLREWETQAMNFGAESTLLTVREVAERHGSEVWYRMDKQAQQPFFRFLVPAATELETEAALAHAHNTFQGYDFELFRQLGLDHRLDDRLLTELSYTVFDTETTGLDPGGGDEIIQIGATRIVNGRLLKGDSFDQLIDPQRYLKPESIAIHGITKDMLRGQPTIDRVLPAFFEFCEETVLVGHNAAFDMRFLQIKEASLAIRFTQPLLDTLLLSPVIHPNQESHKLEAIAERLGVAMAGRHNALADAIVTGEVFLKMIPLLAERGIRTLREAREASEKSYYARVKY